ncbi:High-affinity methionine permease [Grifola frondosa]|uniref:High-affinity methionine permease n=1 Tax=Grifola frondosa TaxID=5627 RepID=A0A1C7LTQ8_GRIFR|nr:High-affinity methionine permease [Grifola frondosa]
MSSLLKFLPFRKAEDTSGEPAVATEQFAEEKISKSPGDSNSVSESLKEDEVTSVLDPELNPGALALDEDAAGGMGRHLGVFSCTLLIVGRIIGTGIFSTPSSILGSVGSVGASLMLWVLGSVLSFCGLFIWLEFGTMFPRSGGEKVYLEIVYQKPRYLATILFAANAILLGFTAAGCIVFASNILVSAGQEAVIFFVTVLHGLTPRVGTYLMNALSVFKIVILLFIIVTGMPNFAILRSLAHCAYATATFKVLFSYGGWSNVNYVMNNVKNPVRTLMIAGPLGLGICVVLNLLANVAYFAAATKDEIKETGVTVASLFFANVFGSEAQRALTVFVALSQRFGTFAVARVNQELAKEGIPLPFGNRFWASNWPTGKSPLPGLIIHLIPSIIVIIAPPPAVAYPFILDIEGYPQQIINFFVVIGLFWLRWRKPNAVRPFKVWWPLAVFFLAAAVFLLVAPFLRPANKVGDTPPLPYYLYCLVGIAVMAFGILYWAAWRIVPGWFGYELVPRKETFEDGTVVTLFSTHKKAQ